MSRKPPHLQNSELFVSALLEQNADALVHNPQSKEDGLAIQKKLIDTSNLLTSIIKHLPIPVFVKRASDLSFILFNKANENLTGVCNEDVVGKTDYDFFPKEQADFFTQKDREAILSGELLETEEELLTQDQQRKILHTLKVTVPDASGKPLFLLGISEDITEKKHLEEVWQEAYRELEAQVQLRTQELLKSQSELELKVQERTTELLLANDRLRKMERIRRRLVSSLTHDLKTPLIAQARVLEMLASEAEEKEFTSITALLQGFKQNNQDLITMINHMLETYELEDGHVSISCASVSLFPVVETSCQSLQALADVKHIVLSNQIPETLPHIQADVLLMKRLLNNLLGNAINYCPNGTSVQITAKKTHQNIELHVIDNGPGIPADVLPYIFTHHFAQKVTKRKIGSGLGLYICKMIVDLHHGSISVQSSPKMGTHFCIRLPITATKHNITSREKAPMLQHVS